MTPIRLIPWLLLLALVAFSALTYDTLPEQIPQHLDFSGDVTRAAAKSPQRWAMLPLIAAVTLALVQAISHVLPRNPALFNFPGKHKLLALPAAYQAPVVAKLQDFLAITSIVTVLVMCGAQWLLWRAALGHSTSGASMLVLVFPVVLLAALLLHLSAIVSATDAAHDAWKTSARR
jgi:uncharacterized membrane protein